MSHCDELTFKMVMLLNIDKTSRRIRPGYDMRAVYYTKFKGKVSVENLPDPAPPPAGVVIRVRASGICRSDWHGWQGHDPDISLPHVPGHELSGIIEETGSKVKNWERGDRVTLPFVCACGVCTQCSSGNHQVCDHQFQPGFTHWGSFARYVAVDYADTNLVRLPEDIDFATAASLGCRFATAFRAVVDQGAVAPDQWVAVHGCGGVGLSVIMIARAFGARVIAVDITQVKLNLALEMGACHVINSTGNSGVSEEIQQISNGGAELSIDAVGYSDACFNSVSCLGKRGKHVQIGLFQPGERNTRVPMDLVVEKELEIIGSHGMQAHRYPQMLDMVLSGELQVSRLIHKRINLDDVPSTLSAMDRFEDPGITVIDRKF